MAVTVIVIENDSQVQDFLCSILESQRYRAIRATTYEEALQKLGSSTVDLAVSDGFTANGISGISLLHRSFPHLRLIVISGVSRTRPKFRCRLTWSMSFPSRAAWENSFRPSAMLSPSPMTIPSKRFSNVGVSIFWPRSSLAADPSRAGALRGTSVVHRKNRCDV